MALASDVEGEQMVLGATARLGAWRRTAVAAAVVGSAFAATAMVTAGPSGAQQPGFNNGTGSAIAQSIRVDPVAGGLSFGVGIAEALAGHQNTVGVAESRSVNLGVIGTSLAGQGCDGGDPTLPREDQPGTLRTASNEEGSEEGIRDEDPKVPGIQREVRATDAPFAEAITRSPGLDLDGQLVIGPTISYSSSGVFSDEGGTYRRARAISEISSIRVPALQVVIEGLRWEAIHTTPSDQPATGTFTIGRASIAGSALPIENPLDTLEELNAVLGVMGLELRAPEFREDRTGTGTLATYTPLSVAVVPAEARDSITGALIEPLRPARQQLFAALHDADCSTGAFITVFNVISGSFGPGGNLALSLGGVQATTAEIKLFAGLGQLPPLPPLSPPAVLGAGAAGTPGSPGTPARPGVASSAAPTGQAAPAAQDGAVEEMEEVAATAGERGGPLLWTGLAGLGLLALAAEGDRRKMRQAQRAIPMEA